MNPKILLAFAGGALLASGIVYWAVRPEPVVKPPLVISSAAPLPPVETETPRAPVNPSKPRAAKPATVVQPEAPIQDPRHPQPAPTPTPAPPAETQVEAPAPAPTPPPPPQPHKVTVPAGTVLQVRVGETISTRKNQPGDAFLVTLAQPLVVDGFVIAERGARGEGRIVEADRGGKVRGTSKLTVELTKLTTADGQHIRIRTASFDKVGQSPLKKDAAKVGIGAALGAAIGAIAGGGKGAGIGAGVGGAAGAGDVLLTRGPEVVIPVETRLSFRVQEPVLITERL